MKRLVLLGFVAVDATAIVENPSWQIANAVTGAWDHILSGVSWVFRVKKSDDKKPDRKDENAVDLEQVIATKLGWSRFPAILSRADPEEVIGGPDSMNEVFDMTAFNFSLQELIARLTEDSTEKPVSSFSDSRITWGEIVHEQLLLADESIPYYDTLLTFLHEAKAADSNFGKVHRAQIAKDSTRHGYPAEVFDGQIRPESLARDCVEVCEVYALVANPNFGYIQGMIDFCFAFKLVGKMSNEEAFVGLAAMTKLTALLDVPHTDLDERTFVYGQLYIHMFAQLQGLGEGNVFELIDSQSVNYNEMLPGHLMASGFDQFTISAGFRGANPLQLAPMMDFVTRNGRAGLMAIFFAGLEINTPVIEQFVAEGRAFNAARFVGDPLAPGSRATIERLVALAAQYLGRSVGTVPFPVAVEIIDRLALDFVPRKQNM